MVDAGIPTVPSHSTDSMASGLDFKTTMAFEYGVAAGMAPGVVRLVARNPSKFTFKGTNTYLVGSTSLAVIDPGPEDAAHVDDILATANGRPITSIVLTHRHRDHADGIAALQAATGAKTFACPRPPDTARTKQIKPTGQAFIAYAFEADVALAHGDVISGTDWELTALATPGHAPDHMCFALAGRDVLFTGDHVMAWNTTVVAPPEGRMADYLSALQTLLDNPAQIYLPGHGGRIETGHRTVKAYLLHRKWREQAILSAIRSGVPTILDIVKLVYQGLDEALVTAAALSVQAHVEHLMEKRMVRAVDATDVTFETELAAVSE